MRVSDLKPGQTFKLATDPRTLTALAYDNGKFAVDSGHNLVGCHPDSYCELVADAPGKSLPFTISHYSGDGKQCSGRVQIGNHGIDIFFDGYGTFEAAPDYGPPVYIEVDDNGHPVVRAWAEIDCQDATHKINLAMARDNRPAE